MEPFGFVGMFRGPVPRVRWRSVAGNDDVLTAKFSEGACDSAQVRCGDQSHTQGVTPRYKHIETRF